MRRGGRGPLLVRNAASQAARRWRHLLLLPTGRRPAGGQSADASEQDPRASGAGRSRARRSQPDGSHDHASLGKSRAPRTLRLLRDD